MTASSHEQAADDEVSSAEIVRLAGAGLMAVGALVFMVGYFSVDDAESGSSDGPGTVTQIGIISMTVGAGVIVASFAIGPGDEPGGGDSPLLGPTAPDGRGLMIEVDF